MPLAATWLLLDVLRALSTFDPPPEEAIEMRPSQVRHVEARWAETVLRGRPHVPHGRLATVARGTRLVVRAEVASRDDAGCNGEPWYAVWPFGFVCSGHVRPTDEPPSLAPVLSVPDGERLPFSYAMVRHDGIPMYASREDVKGGIIERELTKGMSLAVERALTIDGRRYIQDADGKLIPRDGVGYMGQGSPWQGVMLDVTREGAGPLFAWVGAGGARVRKAPGTDGPVVDSISRRVRVPLLESRDHEGRPRTWRIGPGRWVEADRLNEVHAIDPPEGVLPPGPGSGQAQWIDVDLGEQVLVAYRGRTPVFATLISSGRASPTPRGNYPVWAKVATMHMQNQGYEDKPYMVQNVPWVLLFQGHNALHAAYWHDGFGRKKSHGCVNLSPRDAHWMFEWTGPRLLAGFTGVLPRTLEASVMVHVRDSSRSPGNTFTQERPIGPPDREEERRKLEAAQERRALLAAQEAEEDPGNPLHDDAPEPAAAPRIDETFLPPPFGAAPRPDPTDPPADLPPP